MQALPSTPAAANAAIGVFDSGLGGLSVLRHIHAQLPHEDLLYFADSGYAPYGNRTDEEIGQRALAIASFLLERGAKALVVACNTATAAAINALRQRYPDLPLVGVEPGLKPAAAVSTTGTVGVLATASTLASNRFLQLRDQLAAASNVRFLSQACVGLADQVEKGELDSRETHAMVQRYVSPLLAQGADTLVLGCTHYPFVLAAIERATAGSGQKVTIIDTGDAVSRQLVRLLEQRNLRNTSRQEGTIEAFTTGSHTALIGAFTRLLELRPPIAHVAAEK